MVMSHNLHTNLGNWCIFPENKLIYQGKWLKPQIVSGAEIICKCSVLPKYCICLSVKFG